MSGKLDVGGCKYVKLKDAFAKGKPITSRFVYEIRLKKGKWKRCCRWTPRGFQEIPGVHFNPDLTFATNPPLCSIRYLVATAAKTGRRVYHIDFKRAFSTSPLKKETTPCAKIYVLLPKGYQHIDDDGDECCIEMSNSMYGLKQSNRDWMDRVVASSKELQFEESTKYPSLFIGKGFTIVVWIDDFFVLPPIDLNQEQELKAVTKLANDFQRSIGTDVDVLGLLTHALGIDFEWGTNADGTTWVTLGQERYIDQLLHRYEYQDLSERRLYLPNDFDLHKALDTPLLSGVAKRNFQSMTGSLLYAYRSTRPDIAVPLWLCTKFGHAPTEGMLKAMTSLFRYVKFSKSYKICYGRVNHSLFPELAERYKYDVNVPVGIADANHSTSHKYTTKVNPRSVNFALVFYNGAAVEWKLSQMTRIALSSTEAELSASNLGARLLEFARHLFTFIGNPMDVPYPLLSDSKGALANIKHPIADGKLIHVEPAEYFARECQKNGRIISSHVPRAYMIADIGTHLVSSPKFLLEATCFIMNMEYRI